MNRIFKPRWRFVLWCAAVVSIACAWAYMWAVISGFESIVLAIVTMALVLLALVFQHLIDSAETLEDVWLSDKNDRVRMKADLHIKVAMLIARTAEIASTLARETTDRSQVVDQKFQELSEKLDDNTRVTNETNAALKEGKR